MILSVIQKGWCYCLNMLLQGQEVLLRFIYLFILWQLSFTHLQNTFDIYRFKPTARQKAGCCLTCRAAWCSVQIWELCTLTSLQASLLYSKTRCLHRITIPACPEVQHPLATSNSDASLDACLLTHSNTHAHWTHAHTLNKLCRHKTSLCSIKNLVNGGVSVIKLLQFWILFGWY